jgi:pyridoxal phosphate enzyme (YggS family)
VAPGERARAPEPARQGRRAELAAGLAAVRERIRAGCAPVGRDPAGVTLVVVTKAFPAGDVRLLAGLGVHDVGENRDAEAAGKVAESADLDLRWHFIGRLQTNKARSVARYAAMVHSVDRGGLVAALDRAASAAGVGGAVGVGGRRLDVLLQVSLDGDPARGGVAVGSLEALAEQAAAASALRLRGIMAVAPLGVDPYRSFAVLPELSGRVRGVVPDARLISAGMSGDLEAALSCGATHLRVGSSVLGCRASLG